MANISQQCLCFYCRIRSLGFSPQVLYLWCPGCTRHRLYTRCRPLLVRWLPARFHWAWLYQILSVIPADRKLYHPIEIVCRQWIFLLLPIWTFCFRHCTGNGKCLFHLRVYLQHQLLSIHQFADLYFDHWRWCWWCLHLQVNKLHVLSRFALK